jgi:hypothetical protein
MMSMTTDTILNQLQARRNEMQTRFRLRRIALFGSYLHGKQTPNSDIDFLVEMDRPDFDAYMELKFYLEDLFGKPVDLVLPETIKPRIKSSILKEALYA